MTRLNWSHKPFPPSLVNSEKTLVALFTPSVIPFSAVSNNIPCGISQLASENVSFLRRISDTGKIKMRPEGGFSIPRVKDTNFTYGVYIKTTVEMAKNTKGKPVSNIHDLISSRIRDSVDFAVRGGYSRIIIEFPGYDPTIRRFNSTFINTVFSVVSRCTLDEITVCIPTIASLYIPWVKKCKDAHIYRFSPHKIEKAFKSTIMCFNSLNL
jgi:hypothetical protein